MGTQLLAIVAEGPKGRSYLNATDDQIAVARSVTPSWFPDTELPLNPRDFKTPNYGMRRFGDLFTARQLEALNRCPEKQQRFLTVVSKQETGEWSEPFQCFFLCASVSSDCGDCVNDRHEFSIGRDDPSLLILQIERSSWLFQSDRRQRALLARAAENQRVTTANTRSRIHPYFDRFAVSGITFRDQCGHTPFV